MPLIFLIRFDNSWYTKAFCRLKKQPRTFAVRRIKKAELTRSRFTPDKEIISSVTPDDFLGFEKVKNVKLQADPLALDRLKSSPLHSAQVIRENGIVEIPAVSEEVLFPFILSQSGNVRLLEPENLRNKLKNTLQKMLDNF